MNLVVEPRTVHLTTRTGISVRRTLPTRQVRTIGAWCFLDHYGPTQDAGSMSVAAHPHVGLQTVSWLFSGQLEHRDSVSSLQVIDPGELNLMTAGFGIAHSELSEPTAAPLHGVQLWVALPESARLQAPHFEHHADLPDFEHDGARIRLLVGNLLEHSSPAATYSPLVGAQMILGNSVVSLRREPEFEYGILPVDNAITVNETIVPSSHLVRLDDHSENIAIDGPPGSTLMFLGGQPFSEPMVMWWNFIGRSHDEVAQMRSDWENASERFGAFTDRIGGRIPAPDLPTVELRPRLAQVQRDDS